ncbi:MAG TPA: hypothetical protein VGF63_12195 [Solirubrobacteraceae bacterium]|jgi:hypothetical protein
MDFTKLSQGDRVVLGVGIVLIVDLLFLPWYHVDLGGLVGIDSTRSAVQSPNAGYGLIAFLVVLVMVGQIVASKLMSANLPDPPVPWGQVHLFAGAVVLLLLLLKLVAETSFLGFGSYLGLLLAAGLAYGGYLVNQESSSLA